MTGILDFTSAEERSEYVAAVSAADDASESRSQHSSDTPAARQEPEVDPTPETNSGGGGSDAGVCGDTGGDEGAREGHDEPGPPGLVGSTPLPPDSGDAAAAGPELSGCEPTGMSPDR